MEGWSHLLDGDFSRSFWNCHGWIIPVNCKESFTVSTQYILLFRLKKDKELVATSTINYASKTVLFEKDYYDLHPGWSTPLYVPLMLTHDVPFPHHTPHSSLFDVALSWLSHPIGWHLPLMQMPRESCTRQVAPSGSLMSVLWRREVPVGMQWEIHMSSPRCRRCSVQRIKDVQCHAPLRFLTTFTEFTIFVIAELT